MCDGTRVPRRSEPTSDALGRLLREARGGRSLRRVAAAAGVSLTHLHGIETGQRRPRSADELLAIAHEVGADENAVIAVAGAVPSAAAKALLSPGLRRALRGGQFTKDGITALRLAHLRALAGEYRPDGDVPVDVASFLMRRLGVDHKESPAAPGFESPGLFLVPPGQPAGRRRMLLAHAAGHLLLARDPGKEGPSCQYGSGSVAEHEADYLAEFIAVPPARLRAEREKLAGDYDQDQDEDFLASVADLASAFQVPATVIVTRIAAEGISPWPES
jgi:transcriptional regulator with XRE-family HTH domain